MIIRIDSIDYLTADVAYYLGKIPQTLLEDIKNFDFRNDDSEGYAYIEQNRREVLDDIYLCHISRKLTADDIPKLLPLNQLITTANSFSDFLKRNGVCFETSSNGDISLVYKRTLIDWQNNSNPYFNPIRFKSRLCEDFCVNGFQFLYDISKQFDHDRYAYAPEFLQDLDSLLGANLVDEFRTISHTFVALCRVPKGKIVFDSRSNDGKFEERYIYSSLSYIWEYTFPEKAYGYNCVLRALDDYIVNVERWIAAEELPGKCK